MPQIYIGVGSNIHRQASLLASVGALVDAFGNVSLSRVFESEAVGFDGDNFYNMVVGALTDKTLQSVCDKLREIEVALGRAPDARKFSSRTVDLDLLLYGNMQCELPLMLPRPEITENAFVLWPLSELAGSLCHPGTDRNYSALWRNYSNPDQKLWPTCFDWSELPPETLSRLTIQN